MVGMDADGYFGLAYVSELQHKTSAAIEYYYDAFISGHSEAQNRLSIYAHRNDTLAMYYYGLTKTGLESIIWIFLSYNHGHHKAAYEKLQSLANYDPDAKKLLDAVDYQFDSYSAVIGWLRPTIPTADESLDSSPDSEGYDYWKDILS